MSQRSNWSHFFLEFLSVFIAVVFAFALNNWNDNRKDRIAESKILTEISHGISKDLEDIKMNSLGHTEGIRACKFWSNVINNQEQNLDTMTQFYFAVTRDFVSIQNTSGYETLKSQGLESIQNDSLRAKIITLYEYDYKTLLKLEEEYSEVQFHDSYFHELNRHIAPNFRYDDKGNIKGLDLPLKISKSDKKILLSYLWKIRMNRNFLNSFYKEVEGKIAKLKKEIENELR